MSDLTNEELQSVLDRECKGLRESGISWSAMDVIDDVVKELLYRREEAKKNDEYIDELEKRLAPCTCQSGKCRQHDDD